MNVIRITKNFLFFEDWQTGIFTETALYELLKSETPK